MDHLKKYTKKSSIKLYSVIWLILTILLFLVWSLQPIFAKKHLELLFFGYIILVNIPIGMTFSYKQIDIFNYIKNNHQKKWKKHFGTELSMYSSSVSKLKRICFSKEDFGDPILHLMRIDYRSFFIFTYSVLICTIVIDFIILLAFSVK